MATRLGYVIQGDPYLDKSIQTFVPGLYVEGLIVMDLLSELPHDRRYVFFYNFFISFRLLEALKMKGYYRTGTVDENRVEKVPVPETITIKKEKKRMDLITN